jgi:hypothetical protein
MPVATNDLRPHAGGYPTGLYSESTVNKVGFHKWNYDGGWPVDGVDQLIVSTDPNTRNFMMSKKASDHHKKASEHHSHAARHHEEAAKHHEAGHYEKAAHYAQTAMGHAIHARTHSEEAVKAHAEEHGKK